MQAAGDRLFGDGEQIDRLLGILSDLRADLGRANAECGIWDLLGQRASLKPVSMAMGRVGRIRMFGGGSVDWCSRFPQFTYHVMDFTSSILSIPF
jgi:hypothetical protein